MRTGGLGLLLLVLVGFNWAQETSAKFLPLTVNDCFVPYLKSPVCGNNGITYANQFLLDCANSNLVHGHPNITAVHEGFCKPKVDYDKMFEVAKDRCIPPIKNLERICGSDGVNYKSRYELECSQLFLTPEDTPITIDYYGKCTTEIYLNSVITPKGNFCHLKNNVHFVCGSDGKNYRNPQNLECINKELDPGQAPIEIAFDGSCAEKDGQFKFVKFYSAKGKLCYVPNFSSPVCGSNGVTYTNEYEMECDNLDLGRRQRKIAVAYQNNCKEEDIKAWEND